MLLPYSPDVAQAYVEVQKAESQFIIKHDNTSSDPNLPLSVVKAPPWSDSRPREYLPSNEIKARLADYQPASVDMTCKTSFVPSEIILTNEAAILDPSDIIVNIDNEIASTQFSRNHTLDVLFPGIAEEMNRLLGA
jgi:hypothetical protein